MCGRFDTSHLTWAEIHDQLSGFANVTTRPLNLEPDGDVRPTTAQLTVRMDGDGWVLEKMRWGLVPSFWSGKPLKDTAKGAKDGFKLTTFNCKVENFEPGAKRSATFAQPFQTPLSRAGQRLVRVDRARRREGEAWVRSR